MTAPRANGARSSWLSRRRYDVYWTVVGSMVGISLTLVVMHWLEAGWR